MAVTAERHPGWLPALIVFLLLIPIFVIAAVDLALAAAMLLWLWPLLLLAALGWLIVVRRESARAIPPIRMLYPEEQPVDVRRAMDVELATDQGGILIFRGRLRVPPTEVYSELRRAEPGLLPLLQEDRDFGAAIALVPEPAARPHLSARTQRILSLSLAALALVRTTFAGAAHQGINLLAEPERYTAGLPYALALMLILGLHELGHYLTARHHRMDVSPPFFIPVPFALGTFGAFIRMRSPPENRTTMFDVAIAGPLAGLVVAVPALFFGLESSTVLPGADMSDLSSRHGASVGSSILLAVIAKLSIGESLVSGHIVQLTPLAFAGWLGLFVTALNLMPIGQLDGGHMARAMFGSRHGMMIGRVAMWSLLLLALFVWPGLLLWALLVFLVAGQGVPPLDDLSPISGGRKLLGYLTFVVFLAIITPLPPALWAASGIDCPWV